MFCLHPISMPHSSTQVYPQAVSSITQESPMHHQILEGPEPPTSGKLAYNKETCTLEGNC